MIVDCRKNPINTPGSASIERQAFRLKRWLTYEYLRYFENPAKLQTRQGIFRVPIGVEDPISRQLFLEGEFELELIREVMQMVRDWSGRPKGKGTLIDIGANNGVISIGMLTTGELERAVAIEPEPANFNRLTENVGLNALDDRMLCIQAALSDKPATLAFELSNSNWGDHHVRAQGTEGTDGEVVNESNQSLITVESQTLDELIAGLPPRFHDDIAAIWIDVQGYAGFVFAGGREVLSRDIPVVAEIWPYGIARAKLSLDYVADLVASIWGAFWIKRDGRFVKQPILAFRSWLDGLDANGAYDNVIFTRG